ncbi:MAG: tRNA pseudouridine(38-40) synthase TruA [Acholeplasmataceae bacterium]|nr:tRNA pseudouridine(38-40) synthase TruA [Acholeplasmataceae bacterium]
MRYKVTVSYDGTNYHGFQKQKNAHTIEAEINAALFKIHKHDIKIVASGRTDKGVHALGQVFHFDSNLEITANQFKRALNSHLPKDIRILEVSLVSGDFNARHSAIKKTYKYVINKEYDLFNRNHEFYYPYKLDIELLEKALKKFIGTHDFFGFAGYVKDKPTIKEIYEAYLIVDGSKIILIFTGNGFLKYMVRKMVGTLLDIATNKKDINVIDEIFKTKDRNLSGKTINPEGLYLVKVYY